MTSAPARKVQKTVMANGVQRLVVSNPEAFFTGHTHIHDGRCHHHHHGPPLTATGAARTTGEAVLVTVRRCHHQHSKNGLQHQGFYMLPAGAVLPATAVPMGSCLPPIGALSKESAKSMLDRSVGERAGGQSSERVSCISNSVGAHTPPSHTHQRETTFSTSCSSDNGTVYDASRFYHAPHRHGHQQSPTRNGSSQAFSAYAAPPHSYGLHRFTHSQSSHPLQVPSSWRSIIAADRRSVGLMGPGVPPMVVSSPAKPTWR